MKTYTLKYRCGHDIEKTENWQVPVLIVPMNEVCPACWEKRDTDPVVEKLLAEMMAEQDRD